MIPMPTKQEVTTLQQSIRLLMKRLEPTVDSLELATPQTRHNVGCVEDAYYGLQDALEALEDIEE